MTGILTLFLAYSFRHTLFPALHLCSLEEASPPRECSPTMLPPRRVASIRSFGDELESRPLSAQIHLTSELLRTL